MTGMLPLIQTGDCSFITVSIPLLWYFVFFMPCDNLLQCHFAAETRVSPWTGSRANSQHQGDSKQKDLMLADASVYF